MTRSSSARTHGHIKISRRSFELDPLFSKTPWSEWHAWVWLIGLAQHHDYTLSTSYGPIPLTRGQLVVSYSLLAEKAGWTEKRARGFIDWCCRDGRLAKVRPHRAGNVLALPNYDAHQGSLGGVTEVTDAAAGTAPQAERPALAIVPPAPPAPAATPAAEASSKPARKPRAKKVDATEPAPELSDADPLLWGKPVTDRLVAALAERKWTWGDGEWGRVAKAMNPKRDSLRWNNLSLDEREARLTAFPSFLRTCTSAGHAVAKMRDLLTCDPAQWAQQARTRKDDGTYLSFKKQDEAEQKARALVAQRSLDDAAAEMEAELAAQLAARSGARTVGPRTLAV